MPLVALHSQVRPGRGPDYDRAHARIPDELVEAHRRAGIRDWSIWRSGDHLFHLVDCDDFDAAVRQLEHDPANQRWQAFIGDYVERLEIGDEGSPALALVWRMRDQAPD